MRVRMVQQVSGSRDGAPWPEPGVEIDLPDVEARSAIQGGVAVDASEKVGETVYVPPAGVHTPGRTAYGDVHLVEVPADSVADPESARKMYAARVGADADKADKLVPSGTGVQNRDGTAMTAEGIDKSLADDEQTAKDLGLPSPSENAPASKAGPVPKTTTKPLTQTDKTAAEKAADKK